MSRISKSVKAENKLMVARCWEEEGMGVTANRYTLSFGKMKTF